jgi:tRNA modification GTPase
MPNIHLQSTICALSTSPGLGAIALIRVSGPDSVAIVGKLFNKSISDLPGHSVVRGNIMKNNEILDEVLVTIFRGPKSYTGEDVVEIACHGSRYIQQQILQLLMSNGCDAATPGEYTMRAFMNGKMDLSQAEAVADLIGSYSAASHKLAVQQLRGGFSREINKLRDELIHFASLVELELDFAEEDVEFADRKTLKELVIRIKSTIQRLKDSYAFGNVLKNGIPVAIVGVPNVGKSTLMNALMDDDKAIVSEIAGTTRDAIEDELVINGVEFRFIDTAGLRETRDRIETLGIEKTYRKIDEASVILYLVDAVDISREDLDNNIQALTKKIGASRKKLILVANKTDKANGELPLVKKKFSDLQDVVFISAREHHNLHELKQKLFQYVQEHEFNQHDVVVTNARHYTLLGHALKSITEVEEGMTKNIPGDLLAIDIRKTLHHLGEITGEVTTDDLLGNIFARFCIGK